MNQAHLSCNNLRRWLSLSSDLAECDTVHWGVNCNQSCDCTQNSISCDSKFGCHCKDGWSGTHCEVNIDECVGGGPCGGLENCVDTPGSYVCQCMAGYLRNQTTGNCESRSYNSSFRSKCQYVCSNIECNPFYHFFTIHKVQVCTEW